MNVAEFRQAYPCRPYQRIWLVGLWIDRFEKDTAWEAISYPYEDDNGVVVIQVRHIGKPETVRTVVYSTISLKPRPRFRIHLPWNNLGCFGVEIGRHFYADIYWDRWKTGPMLFVNFKGWRGMGRYRVRLLSPWKVYAERQ